MMEECEVYSPLTGTITMHYVEDGVTVEQGDKLVGVECMKMIHEITAPFPGVLRHKTELGSVVGEDDVVAIIEIDC